MSVHDADYKKIKKLLGVPEEEPIFVLRGNDDMAVHMLATYKNVHTQIEDPKVRPDGEWFAQMDEVIQEFANFRMAFPDKIKVAD